MREIGKEEDRYNCEILFISADIPQSINTEAWLVDNCD